MKKLNNFKWFTLGIIVCIFISNLVVPATAASRSKQATLYYNDIKVTLNDDLVVPKDVNGNVIEPFIIDGTTYLPVRGVADALGVNVRWSGPTNTVILNTNRFITSTPVPQYRDNDIYFTAYEAWYENGKLHARMIITNGYNSKISAINVKRMQISNSDGLIADGNFGVLQNATIAPKGYIIWELTFSGDALIKLNADLTGALYTDCSTDFKH